MFSHCLSHILPSSRNTHIANELMPSHKLRSSSRLKYCPIQFIARRLVVVAFWDCGFFSQHKIKMFVSGTSRPELTLNIQPCLAHKEHCKNSLALQTWISSKIALGKPELQSYNHKIMYQKSIRPPAWWKGECFTSQDIGETTNFRCCLIQLCCK